MKNRLYLILFMVVFAQSVFSNEFKEVVDKDISFKWNVEGANLHIILSAPTEGWIAVGFNPSRVMKDADFKLAAVSNGKTIIEDHFGTGLFGHKSDTSIGGSSDYQLVNGRESGGVTTIEFTIPLNSGDEYDKILVKGDEVKVLLAYGSNDDMTRKHKARTSVVIEL